MKNIETLAVHSGKQKAGKTQGVNTPIITDSAFKYRESGTVMYPRYFNTPNNKVIENKMADLEHGEASVIFSSGMAAITTSLFTFLRNGDHAIFSSELYGGTYNLIVSEFQKRGIKYSFVEGKDPEDFKTAIHPETRVLYVESPSNPLLHIYDLAGLATLSKKEGIISMIDNTFASPINQNPITLGFDIVVHSGTKYLGGHSDLCFGVAISQRDIIENIRNTALNYGGSLNGLDLYLIERSLKTLPLRVKKQTENAFELAHRLQKSEAVKHVFYPGLSDHERHDIAARQMSGYGGMLSFELNVHDKLAIEQFLDQLTLIDTAVSLGGIETTISSPVATSHSKMPKRERKKMGITDKILRLSVGIEHVDDLFHDIENAFQKVERKVTVVSP